MPQKPRRPVSDEEVLDWWEYYLEVRSVTITATHFERFDATIRYHLQRLGVFEETPPIRRRKITSDIDRMVERILEGDWTESEHRIAAALRRIAYAEEATRYNPHLPYADALPHVKRNTRHSTVMSARQRAQDAGCSGFRHEIRAELAAAGMLTRVRPRGPMYFT